MLRIVVAGAVVMASVAGAGAVESKKTTTVGKPVMVAFGATFFNDCRSGPVPIGKVVRAPAHGAVAFATARAKIPDGRCAGTETRYAIAVYKPAAGFRGVDSMAISFHSAEWRQIIDHDDEVTVDVR